MSVMARYKANEANDIMLPRNEPKGIPTYTEEELEADVCKVNPWLFYYERTVCVCALAAMCVYLQWRVRVFLMFPSTYWISIPLLVSEFLLILPGLFISYFIIWHRILRPLRRMGDLNIPKAKYPGVDVLIPCYKEPVEIIKETVIAACNIDYLGELTVVVCDDGNREETRKMFDTVYTDVKQRRPKVNLKYEARNKDKKTDENGKLIDYHAKAGNLNNAIFNIGTKGQFIVVFDCDMVCEPEFVNALLPHFYHKDPSTGEYEIDENIALVQSPQSFYGVPVNDPLGQQYRYFYGPVLQGWDGAGSAPCCGTNVMFSRKCLTSQNVTGNNGFAYGSVTEDFLTSMCLHSLGYKSKYVHEYLARGLSPDSLNDFMKQRLRWAAGAVEIFIRNNALFCSGLNMRQTYLYFWSGFQAIIAYPLLMVCVVPFISLADKNIQVSPSQADEYLYYMGTFLFFNIWMLIVSYRDVPMLYLVRSVQESVFMLYMKLQSVAEVLFKGKLQFVTTSKNVGETSAFYKDLVHIIPHIIYYIAAMIGTAWAVYNVVQPNAKYEYIMADVVSLIWIYVVLWQLWPPIGVVLADARKRMQQQSAAKAMENAVPPSPQFLATP